MNDATGIVTRHQRVLCLFRPKAVLLEFCFISHRSRRRTASVIWDQRPLHGSIGYMKRGRAGGRRFPWAQPDTATHPSNFKAGMRRDLRPAYEQFCHQQAHWLENYALFRALKEKHHGTSYLDWPAELIHRTPAAITRARRELSTRIDQVRFTQFLIFQQAQRVIYMGPFAVGAVPADARY